MRVCRSCGSDNVSKHFELPKTPLYMWPCEAGYVPNSKPLQLLLCEDCDLLQTPPLSDFELKEIYSGKQFNLENLTVNQNRFDLVLYCLGSFHHGQKFIEIGGGRNAFIPLLPESVERTVVDFSVMENVKTQVDQVFEIDFLDLNLGTSRFDGSFLFHVLEHLEQPLSVIKKIARHTKTDGKIFVEVPNFAYDCLYQPHYALFHMHLSMFTKESLISLMAAGGFHCDKIYQENAVIFASFKKGASSFKIPNDFDYSLKHIKNLQRSFARFERSWSKVLATAVLDKCAIFSGGGSANLFLYAFPFIGDQIEYSVDNDREKQGRYIYDGKVPIISVEEAKNTAIKNLIVFDESHLAYAETLGFEVFHMKLDDER